MQSLDLLKQIGVTEDIWNDFAQKAQIQAMDTLELLFLEKVITEEQFLQASSGKLGLEFVAMLENNEDFFLANDEVCLFPLAWLRQHMLVPIYDCQKNLLLAIQNPKTWSYSQEVYFTLGQRPLRPILATSSSINALINRAYDQKDENIQEKLSEDTESAFDFDEDSIDDILENKGDAPFIRFVNSMLAQAVRAKVSDIHIEPYRTFSKVRFRLDGILYDQQQLEKKFHPAIVSRLKVMAKLNIAEKRLPQDGRIIITLAGREISLRMSTLPTAFGERIVLRLLEKSEKILSLKELGLTHNGFEIFQKYIKSTNGIILVTGPTGSGKTTTLYAGLQEIASPERNILTIEDPIEYELDGIGQVQVNPKIGLTFASGLRTLVRQDPDVMFIGEIRDTETVEIAVQSALTGHLVLSTLHTNDAPSAITRLLDMGTESYLLSSVLRMVIAQRLIRTLCNECKEAYEPDEAELEAMGQNKKYFKNSLFKAVGCPHCLHSGYKGRVAIYEIMPISDNLRKAIVEKQDATILRSLALQESMESLYFDGMLKVVAGITSIQEVLRVTDQDG